MAIIPYSVFTGEGLFTVFLLLIVLLWLAWTILHQFQLPFTKKGKILSAFSLIPTWRFFAPRPLHTDYEIFYRDKDKDGNLTQFRIIPLREEKSLLNALFNPNARKCKVISDSMRSFRTILAKGNDETFLRSYPYTLLSHFILNLPIDNNLSIERQFIIVRVSDIFSENGNRDLKVVFTSPLLTLNAD